MQAKKTLTQILFTTFLLFYPALAEDSTQPNFDDVSSENKLFSNDTQTIAFYVPGEGTSGTHIGPINLPLYTLIDIKQKVKLFLY